MRKITGITITFGLIFYSIAASAQQYSSIFIDIPSAMIVFGITFGFMLATSSEGDWSVLWRFLAGEKSKSANNPNGITPIQAQSLCLLLLGGSRAALISGFIGTIIGLVVMLMNMDDPSAIGPAMAVAILTLLYGGILSELVLMMMYRIAVKRYWFENQPQPVQNFAAEPPRGNNVLAWTFSGGGLGLILICFLLIIVSMSEIKGSTACNDAVKGEITLAGHDLKAE